MNTRIKGIVILLTFALLAGALCVISYAKDMGECYHCGRTGKFQCPTCGNTGEVVCDGCGGTGRWTCDGEEGKGKCDNGYYVCPSCGGDGLSRPIPADGNAGPCGQCGGSGRIECWKCHGSGGGVCDRCGGSGKNECQNGNCKEARKIGWKCPKCKGTGYMGDGPDFPPEWNDGVHNVPETGDHIITDHSTWTGYYYGTGTTDAQIRDGGNGGNGGNNEGRDPVTGRDYVWFIDVGGGVWNVGGQNVTVKRGGAAVSGVIDVKYGEPFTIEGITDRHTHVYLNGDDGFRVELVELNGDHEYSVESREPRSSNVPYNVTLSVVYEEDNERSGGSDDPSGRDGSDRLDGEEMRYVDFCGGSWNVKGREITARIDGKHAEGVKELKYHDVIKLEGFDGGKMTVRLCGEDGFSVTLIPNGDNEVSIGRYEQEECVLADGEPLKFVIETKEQETDHAETEDRAEHDDRAGDGKEKSGSGVVIVIVAVCVLAAAAVSAIFIVKKRKGKPDAEEKETEDSQES